MDDGIIKNKDWFGVGKQLSILIVAQKAMRKLVAFLYLCKYCKQVLLLLQI
jgi:hypothetical protein